MHQSPVGAVRIGAHKPHEGQVDALDGRFWRRAMVVLRVSASQA
jgi:hypothetical protein